MPKKKTQRNGLYWYMQDLLPELRREGRTFPNGMVDVVPIALPRWQSLSIMERERYEQKARDEKRKGRAGTDNDKYRLDNVGNVVADRLDKDEEREKRRIREGKISRSRWPYKDDFLDFKFYLISFEYFWESDPDEGTALPVEVALVEYSLKQGITKTMQKFIKPRAENGRDIPLGYRFKCTQHSEDRHHIPIMGFEEADDNYTGILLQIENFVNPNGEKHEYPPLYARQNELLNARFALDWLHRLTSSGHAPRLQKVFELENMVLDLYLRVEVPISRGGISSLFINTNFDYQPTVRCPWHEKEDTRFCALGTLRKACYHLSDALSDHYDFELTSSHLPNKDDEIDGAISMGSSNCSTRPTSQLANCSTKTSSAYTTFASRDIRYALPSDDEFDSADEYESVISETPTSKWAANTVSTNPFGSQPSVPFGERKVGSSNRSEARPSLQQAVAQRKQEQSQRGVVEYQERRTRPADEEKRSEVAVGRGIGRGGQAAVGRGVGRGMGRGSCLGRGSSSSTPRAVNAPGKAPGQDTTTPLRPVGRGNAVTSDPTQHAVSLTPTAEPDSKPEPKPISLPQALQRGHGISVESAPAASTALTGYGRGMPVMLQTKKVAGPVGRGRANFTVPAVVEVAPAKVRVPPGFGRGMAIQRSQQPMQH